MSKFAISFAILFASLVGLSEATRRTYDGYSVIRSVPQTPEQIEHLRALMAQSENESVDGQVQFWTRPRVLNASVDVMASPERVSDLADKLARWRVPNEVMIADVGVKIRGVKTGMDLGSITRMQIESNETLRAQLDAANYYSRFQRYSAIVNKLEQLASMDARIKLEIIGQSSERRNLYLVKVSDDHTAKKPVILFDAGHHAREWISHSTIMYLIESLVNIDLPKMSASQCKSEACTRPKLDVKTFDYWFIPIVNPDGYEYTHTANRLWRKTRSRGVFGACPGTDPNRNYPFHWRESGASSFSCSEIYAGPEPMSEPEVRAVVSVLDANKARLLAYISLHSYSQLIMSPYGHQRVYPHNYAELEDAAKKFINSVGKLRNTPYRFGVTSMILYPAAGASDDYAHGQTNVRYTYTIELPDTGNNGFVLPESEIVPVGHEILMGLQSLIGSMAK